MTKTYPYKLNDGRWVIQVKDGNEFKELIVTLDHINQVGWDSIESLDIVSNVTHNHRIDNKKG